MKIRHLATIMASVLIGLSSCDDTTESIGLSLTDKVDHLSISSSVFEATTRSVAINSVISRSSKGYLGRIKDPETGALITGDFMTQFHCMEGYHLTSLDSVASKDEYGRIIADSCELRLFYTSYYGDSLASMKLTLYELDHPMLENQTYYSDFSPLEQGYVREDGIRKSKAYTLVNTTEYKNKQREDDYVNNICIRLNEPYTSKSGETFNNYGSYVLRMFYDHPEYFANSFTFTKNVVPGFFLKMTGGMGSMAYITSPQLNIYYRMYVRRDSISDRLTLFSGTEEVLQTTTVSNDAATIDQLINDNSCTYIKSPSGIFTEVTLPVDDIIRGHEKDTINTAKIVFNRINNEQASLYTLPTPSTLLMVETDSVASFFEKGKLANNKQTYLSTYSSASNNYSFNNIGSLILAMHHAREAGKRTDPEWEAHHPNWNKVMLVPVTTNYTTYNYSTLLTEVANNMSLTSTRLVGGSTPIQISVIYSKFE